MSKRDPVVTAALIAALGAILVSVINGIFTAAANHKASTAQDLAVTNKADLKDSTLGPINEGQKMCNVAVPGSYRNITIVPKSWTTETCKELMIAMRATEYSIGCAYPDGVDFGPPNTTTSPSKKCGW